MARSSSASASPQKSAVHSVAIAVVGAQEAEAVAVAALVAKGLGPQHLQGEAAAPQPVPHGQPLDTLGIGLPLGHVPQIVAGRAGAGKQIVRHEQAAHGRHVAQGLQGAAVVVVGMADGHPVQGANALAGAGLLQEPVLVARVDEQR
jgi:hypothetical protein